MDNISPPPTANFIEIWLTYNIVEVSGCTWWFDTLICYKRITTIALANFYHITELLCVCMCVWWELLRFTLLATFKYYTVLLTIIAILYIRFLEITYLVTGKSVAFNQHLPTSLTHQLPAVASNHHSTLSVSLAFSDSRYKWDHTFLSFSDKQYLYCIPPGST